MGGAWLNLKSSRFEIKGNDLGRFKWVLDLSKYESIDDDDDDEVNLFKDWTKAGG